MRLYLSVLIPSLLIGLACAGIGGPTASQYGAVEFQTYKGPSRTYVKFKTDTKAEKWWANMSGKPPQGTYVQSGEEITVTWDPAFTNHGARIESFKQLGPCSLARYSWTNADGEVKDDDSKMYERTKPKCPK